MTYRSRSGFHHLVSVPRKIWRHPNNRGRRLRRLAASIAFQLRKRLGRLPATLPLGEELRVVADRRAGGVSNLVYFGGYFEYHELRFCERYLRPGDRVVDGGANIGLVSLLLSRWVGVDGRVIAFEPAPAAASLLRRNLELNRVTHVQVFEAALGGTECEMSLIADMDVSNQLVLEAPADHLVATVAVVRLDDVLPGDGSFALTKLDLEGGELAALRGAEALLEAGRLPLILLEALDPQLRRLGASRDELLDLLRDHDYRFGRYDADAAHLAFEEAPRGGSFLAVRAESVPIVESRLAGR